LVWGWFWDCCAFTRNDGVFFEVTLGCIFCFVLIFGFGVVLRLPRYRSQWRCFFWGYTWLHILLCFNFGFCGWFWDCHAIARNDGFFFEVTHGCIFCFVLILGFVCGFEIATLSLAMTVFFWGYTWLHILLCFNFWVWGGFEIATLSLAMTVFFLRLHLVAYFALF